MNTDNRFAIAVDIGGTYLRAAMCDTSGGVLARYKVPTRANEDAETILRDIVESIRGIYPKEGVVIGIGIGVPAPIDQETGTIREAWNVPALSNRPLRDFFEKLFNAPVFFSNDARLAALGECRYGAGRGAKDMIYMTVSTGIGGSVISNGRPLLGSEGLAGELGEQVFASPQDWPDPEVLSLESIASGPNIARRAASLIGQGRASLIRDLVADDLGKITGETVFHAARSGDALAVEVFRYAGFYIGLGLTNLIHVFNPELVVLGGAVISAGAFIMTPIQETVDRYVMPSMKRHVRITEASLGDDAGLIGGAALVVDEVGK